MKHTTLKAFILSTALLTSSFCLASTPPVMAAQEESIVHVTGYAQQQVAPDTALITVGTDTTADTAADARTQNNAVMQHISNALNTMGVAKANIQTNNFSLHPNYEPNNTNRKIKSYTISNSIRIKITDFTLIPQIIEQAQNAGATQMYGIRFTSEHTDAIRASLIKEAIRNGKREAADAAAAAGVSLGNVKEINISGSSPSYESNTAGMMLLRSAKADSTPVEAGSNTISASVDIIFYLH